MSSLGTVMKLCRVEPFLKATGARALSRVAALREKIKEEGGLTAGPLDAKRKVVVLSGKGGVGKSTVATQLALSLADRGLRVGLLDLDICGPSIPHMLGVRGSKIGGQDGLMSPVEVTREGDGPSIALMSIGFLLNQESDAVTLRGPRKDAVVRQFLTGVAWGALDFMIIDTCAVPHHHDA